MGPTKKPVRVRRADRQPERTVKRTDREEIALALLVWRYVGHVVTEAATVPDRSFDRTQRALRLAKLVGVKDEYLRTMFELPVLTVKVKELE
jgi:hypothetical protein